MNTCSFSPCFGQSQIPWVGIFHRLGQCRINTYFISPCLISCQIGTRVEAQKHTPPTRLSSTPTPFAGRLVGRMQYAPTLPAEKSDLKGWRGIMFGAKGEESVFHFSMSNRLSDRYPGRGAKAYAPCAFIVYPHALAGRLVRRMQYAPTLPAEKSDLKGWRGITFRRRGDSLIRRTKKGRIFWREDRRREV